MQKTTVETFLHAAFHKLDVAGIATARLDTLVLLEDVLRTDRAQLLAHLEREITARQLKHLNKMVQRRSEHEPLAYIRNKSEFYGYEFYVDHHVLEPRPESETMIDLLKQLVTPKTATIIDVGTGSGALAITAKMQLPKTRVLAIDIDPGCLKIARHNAEQLQVTLDFVQGDLLDALADRKLDEAILLCNLPYVPDSFQLNPAAMQEPRLAIFGGEDGLDLYRSLFSQLRNRTAKPAFVLTESMPPQHADLAKVAPAAGFVLDRTEDFIQVFKTNSGSSAS